MTMARTAGMCDGTLTMLRGLCVPHTLTFSYITLNLNIFALLLLSGTTGGRQCNANSSNIKKQNFF
jgi:hypothetical protein